MRFQSVRKEEVFYIETPEYDYMRTQDGSWFYDMPLHNDPVMGNLREELEETFKKWMR